MAIVSIPGGMHIPPIPAGVLEGSGPIFLAGTIDAANEAAGTVCLAPRTGNIAAIWYATRDVTTGATIEGRIESVDSSGKPSGSLVGTNTNGTVAMGNGDDNSVLGITLTAAAAVTAGQELAVIIKNPPSSFGNWQIAQGVRDFNNTRLPYGVANTSGAWAVFSQNPPTQIALVYDDGKAYPIHGVHPPCSAITSSSVSTSTTPDVIGLRFRVEAAMRFAGAWLWIDSDGAFDVKLVDSTYVQGSGTGVLSTVSRTPTTRNDTSPGIEFVPMPTVEIAANTYYRLLVEPTSTTAVIVYAFTTPSLALMDAWHGGRDFHLTTAKDPTGDGDWTNYNSGTFRQPFIGVFFDGVEDGSGGSPEPGGYAIAPNLVGGGLVS